MLETMHPEVVPNCIQCTFLIGALASCTFMQVHRCESVNFTIPNVDVLGKHCCFNLILSQCGKGIWYP